MVNHVYMNDRSDYVLKVPCSYKVSAMGKCALLMCMNKVSTPSFVVLFLGNSRIGIT